MAKLQFKSFVAAKHGKSVPLVETTIPDHLSHIPDNWDHHALVDEKTSDKIAKVFGGSDFTHFPLDTSSHEPDSDVSDHLDRHGWSVHDYSKGLASKKITVGDAERGIPEREKVITKKIGSILDETNAHPDTKSAFVNDPARNKSFSNKGGLHVVVSTNPHAIGGMSTGTNWPTSCMNLEGGSNNHYLRHESEHGTHVAFLVHHDDPTAFKTGLPSNPIARIAIKAHHLDTDGHDEDGDDTIFRPEDIYGSGDSKFKNAVAHWSADNYPAKMGLYHKEDKVYNDTVNTYHARAPKDVLDDIKGNRNPVEKHGDSIDSGTIDPVVDHIVSRLKDPNESLESKAVGVEKVTMIGNLGKHHVNRIYRAGADALTPPHMRGFVATHGDKLSTSNITHAVDSAESMGGISSMGDKILMNTKLPSHVVDSLSTEKYKHVHKSLIKPEHITKVAQAYADNGSGSFYSLRHHIDKMTGDDLSLVLSKKDNTKFGHFGQSSVTHLVSKAPAYTRKHHEDILNSGAGIDHHILASPEDNMASRRVAQFLKESPHTTYADVDKYGGHTEFATREKISDADSKKLHIQFMSDVDHDANLDPKKTRRSAYTINGKKNEWKSVPASISKHMTSDDHARLRKTGKTISFDNAAHSMKFADHLFDHAQKLDGALDHHVVTHERLNADYDMDEDDHAQQLHTALHKVMGMHAAVLDNHIDKHVDQDGTIGNHAELEKVETHMEYPHQLEHYKTPSNVSSYREDTSHHDESYGEIEGRIHDMKELTDERMNEHDHHDW